MTLLTGDRQNFGIHPRVTLDVDWLRAIFWTSIQFCLFLTLSPATAFQSSG